MRGDSFFGISFFFGDITNVLSSSQTNNIYGIYAIDMVKQPLNIHKNAPNSLILAVTAIFRYIENILLQT